jgi:putative transposase
MRYRRLRIEGGTYFFTVVTFQRRSVFDNLATVTLLDSAIEKIRAGHPFETVAQVVLPDHLHTIWTLPPEDADFSKRWRLIKESFTRAFRKAVPPARVAPIWQQRFWEHAIRDDQDFETHLNYVHYNPVHHRLARTSSEWPHSTFSKWVERGVYERNWGTGEMPELAELAMKYD